MSSTVSHPAFILVRPQLCENVGTALRALWNCGFSDLRLVRPRNPWPSEKGVRAAAGASDKSGCVRTYACLEDALADRSFVFALTARKRELIKSVFSLGEMQKKVSETPAGQAGFVFGPERSGLTSDEVSLAQAIVSIDLNPDYQSLNLAQSVLLVAHTCFSLKSSPQKGAGTYIIPTKKELFGLAGHLEEALEVSGYFFPEVMKEKMARNLRNMVMRLPLTDQEVRTLRGVVSHFQRLIQKN